MSISPCLSHRMRGLLFPYRFSCVVISFVCAVYGRAKKRERTGYRRHKTEGGKALMGIESLYRESLGESRTDHMLVNDWSKIIDENWNGIYLGWQHEYFQG